MIFEFNITIFANKFVFLIYFFCQVVCWLDLTQSNCGELMCLVFESHPIICNIPGFFYNYFITLNFSFKEIVLPLIIIFLRELPLIITV